MLEKMKTVLAEQLNCDAESVRAATSVKGDVGADAADL